MNLKLEEHRIRVSDDAMVNHDVTAFLDQFQQHTAALPVFSRDQHVEAYVVAVEEMCRSSRKTLWEFVRSGYSNTSQVRDAYALFANCDVEIPAWLGPAAKQVSEFINAIRDRVQQIHFALESAEMEEFAA